MTANVLKMSNLALFLVDARDGLQPMDLDVGKWLRKHAPGVKTIMIMNKAESLDDGFGSVDAAAGEAHVLGFGDPIAISAETGLGMNDLYEVLRPLLEEHMIKLESVEETNEDCESCEEEESKLPLQLAFVGRPNVGKSTLLNAILEEDRVLVGPEAGLTRDSVRVEFEFEGRKVYMVDTTGWLQRIKSEKGAASLSVVQSKKKLMRAHVVALVLDGEEVSKARKSMTHDEVVIARRSIEEGRGLVVIVNKMDLLKERLYDRVVKAVPEEIQTIIPQAIEQQGGGSSDDFQDSSSKEKVVKNRFITDDALEDRICDLYDLYVDGLDEDAGPQVRKLYSELAALWPNGCIDNHEIKRAICRAKDRRKALYRRKDQENLKRKKLLVSKTETSTGDSVSGVLVQHAPDKLATDSTTPIRAITATRPPNSPTINRPKPEKLKGSSDPMAPEVLAKKKAKKKAEAELNKKTSVTLESATPALESVSSAQPMVNNNRSGEMG